jgi:hypothetical protein
MQVAESITLFPDPSVHGGSSAGGQQVQINAYGLNTQTQVGYTCIFSSSDGSSLSTVGAIPTTSNSISCRTPVWGSSFPATLTTLKLYAGDKFRFCPANKVCDNIMDVDEWPTSMAVYNRPTNAYNMEFYFQSVIVSSASVLSGPASGGTLLLFNAYGLSKAKTYIMKFVDSAGHSMQSAPASIALTVHLNVSTPAWGGGYPVDLGGTAMTLYENSVAVPVLSSPALRFNVSLCASLVFHFFITLSPPRIPFYICIWANTK